MQKQSLSHSPASWSRVREVYEDTLEHPPEQRAAMLHLLAESDSEVEAEVRSLLEAHERAGAFLADPLIEIFDWTSGAEKSQILEAGSVLDDRFEIRRYINSGGMGSVYEAWDRELKELVALKTILPEIAADPSAIRYFKEEVRQARRISHPNICRVYDLFCHEQPGGTLVWFLTMQLLAGKTLQEWLHEKGPFSTGEALPLVAGMIAGLSTAHELGVVHRDFKSANVILVATGPGALRAVITDFGLAGGVTLESSRTARALGSPAYAAPEQWYRGIVGPAADQYSLGVVLCEMVTGKRPLIHHNETDGSFIVQLPRDARLTPRWYAVICRCVEPEPRDRFEALDAVLPALDSTGRRRRMRRQLLLATGAITLTAAAGLTTMAVLWKPSIKNLKLLTPIMDLSTSPSLSRDGSVTAYMSDRLGSGISDIWVQHLPNGAAIKVTDDPFGGEDPSVSPDGTRVVFSSARHGGGLYLVNTSGGAETLLAREGRHPRFSPDGRSVLYWTGDDNQVRATGRLFVMELATRRTVQLAPEFTDARDGLWNSDGHHILFKGCPPAKDSLPACWDWWVTTIDKEQPRSTGALPLLAAHGLRLAGELGGWNDDEVLFTAAAGREEHLWQIKISPKENAPASALRTLTPEDARENIISSSLADHHTIALTEFSSAVHVWQTDRSPLPGKASISKVTQDGDFDIDPYVSPDGSWLTFARGMKTDRPLWVKNLSSGKETVFPALGLDKRSPLISDDGRRLAYESWPQDGVPALMVQRAGPEPPLVACLGCRAPSGWFNHGAGILLSNTSLSAVELYRFETGTVQQILSKPGAYITDATWSAAQDYILFVVSDGLGHRQAFAAHFLPGAPEPDRKWIPVTPQSESAQKPRWSEDGKTIYYLSNRDGSWCIWARSFHPGTGMLGAPLAVQHFHASRFSPNGIGPRSRNLSVGGDFLFLNVAEMSGTVWVGRLDSSLFPSLLSEIRAPFVH